MRFLLPSTAAVSFNGRVMYIHMESGNLPGETGRGSGGSVELEMKKPEVIDHASIMEDITKGERVREYCIEGLVGPEKWQILAKGRSIGHKRIQRIHPAEVSKVRLTLLSSEGTPLIRGLKVFSAG